MAGVPARQHSKMGARFARVVCVEVKVRDVGADGTLGGMFNVQVSMSHPPDRRGFRNGVTKIVSGPVHVTVDTDALVGGLYSLGEAKDGKARVSTNLCLQLVWTDNKPSVVYSILSTLGAPLLTFTLASEKEQRKLAAATRFDLADWHGRLVASTLFPGIRKTLEARRRGAGAGAASI